MKHILKIILRYFYLVIIVIGFMALGALGDLWLPNLSRIILDQGIMEGDFNALWQAGLAMLAVALGIISVAVAAHYFDAKLGAHFARDLRDLLYRKIMKFSQVEYDHLSSSSLITRTTNDVQHLQSFFMMVLRMGVRAPAMAIGGIVLSLSLSVEITLILLGGITILAVIITFVARSLTPFSMKVQQGIDKINEVLREKLSGVRVIRAFNTTELEQKRFASASDELRNVNVTLQRIQALFNPTFNLVINVTILGMIYIGKDQVMLNTLSIGSLTAMLSYAQMILFSVIMLTMLMMQLPRATAALKRITEVLNQELAIVDQETSQLVLPNDGSIQFNDVSFRYPGSPKDVLSHLNLTINPHQTTAIIGSTGSGKSTLAKLLLRFYEVSEGSITIGGIDIRQVSLKTLHDFFGYVPQKASLFSGTIASNITYGVPQASQSIIEEAATIAHANEFIHEKEEGFQDQVAQAATNLSGGQKQRLSIARAIAKKPPYYIFDDAFSALDYRTDKRVRQALGGLQTSSFIIVAQRVNTIRHAEHIVVLNDGVIVGEGRHEHLMQTNSTYQEIVWSQLSKEEATNE